MGLYSWGVGVGGDFYEVLSLSRSSTEMAVVGPQGTVALGPFTRVEGGKEAWLMAVQDAIREGKRHQLSWSSEAKEPRARPEGVWQSFEHAGWTLKTDAMIEAWIMKWVEEHPTYCAMDAIGRECNEQTFALAFISWLLGREYRRITDNTKGRVLVYGGLTLLAGVAAAVAVRSMRRPAEEAKEEAKGEKEEGKAEGE